MELLRKLHKFFIVSTFILLLLWLYVLSVVMGPGDGLGLETIVAQTPPTYIIFSAWAVLLYPFVLLFISLFLSMEDTRFSLLLILLTIASGVIFRQYLLIVFLVAIFMIFAIWIRVAAQKFLLKLPLSPRQRVFFIYASHLFLYVVFFVAVSYGSITYYNSVY